MGSIPESVSSPGEAKWQFTPVFLPGKFHGHGNLVGYNIQGRKTARHDSVTEQVI